MHSRALKLLINGISQLLDLVTRLIQQILLVPVLLLSWGVDTYGSWIQYNAIAGFLPLISLGLISYVASNTHIAWTCKKHDLAQRIAETSGFVLVCVSTGGICIAFLLLKWYSVEVTILAVSAIIWMWAGFFGAIYRMADMYSRGLLTVNAVLIIQTVALGGAVVCGADLVIASWVQLCTTCAGIAFMMFDVGNRLPQFSRIPRVPSRDEAIVLARQCPIYFSSSVGSIAFVNAPIILLGAAGIANESIVAFSLVRTISGVIRQACGQLGLSFGTELARLRAIGEAKAFSDLLAITIRSLSSLNGVLAGALAAFGTDLIQIWTKGAMQVELPLLLVFCAVPLAIVTGWVTAIVLSFSNQPKSVARAYILQTLIVIVVGSVGTLFWGALGMAAAAAVAEIVAMGVFLVATGGGCIMPRPVQSMSFSLLIASTGFLFSYAIGSMARAFAGSADISHIVTGLLIWSPAAGVVFVFLAFDRRTASAKIREFVEKLSTKVGFSKWYRGTRN